ncbi:SRPBCC family protein [Nocardia sp. NPDC088792]|uniref:type II toxin-antitoxin system Rv0910 family toxin n=1 Tax=Nocardia sp. NPDC088792 TaxID=3364332 RepID=UPI0038062D64
MGAIHLSKDVPGTPEALFRTIVAPPTWEYWLGIHREFVGRPPQTLVEGSTLVSEVLVHGMSEEVEWTVKKLEEPTRVVLRGKGRAGVQCDLAYQLQGSESGTTVTASVAFTGPLITTNVTKVLVEQGYPQLDRTLGQLAELAYALHGQR